MESPAEAAATLAEALALANGRAFGDLADFELAYLDGLRLDELRFAATEDRAQALIDADSPAVAVALLRPFVSEHPLRERARILLMRALHTMGRTSEGLEQFTAHRTYLADELGLEPSEALTRMQAELLRGPPSRPDDPVRRASQPVRAPVDTAAGRLVRYLRTGSGQSIAYRTRGNGPKVVVILGWVSNLDLIASGHDPRSSLLRRLTGDVSLTLYDRAGTGLSPGPVVDYSLRASVAELADVVAAVGPPVALMAMSAAGPIALTLAHERPEWVDSLVLFGTFCDGPATFPGERLRSMMLEIVRSHWGMGTKTFPELYRPGISDEAAGHLVKVFRDSADPEVAASYLESMYEHDVGDLLPYIEAPALVLHYRSDQVIEFKGGQDLAAGLPNATFLPLDGRFHHPDAADLDMIEDAITSHVRSHSGSNRSLTSG
jgi:pimeloyl-ACP methyl ester carboxylesterase